jgi:hypothetical protein
MARARQARQKCDTKVHAASEYEDRRTG